jgi:hypothetical protein
VTQCGQCARIGTSAPFVFGSALWQVHGVGKTPESKVLLGMKPAGGGEAVRVPGGDAGRRARPLLRSRGVFMAIGRKSRSDDAEPPQQARPRASRNGPWPPPLSGRGRSAFVKRRGLSPAFGRFAGSRNPCSRTVQIVNGPRPARSMLWSLSPRFGASGAATYRPHQRRSYPTAERPSSKKARSGHVYVGRIASRASFSR